MHALAMLESRQCHEESYDFLPCYVLMLRYLIRYKYFLINFLIIIFIFMRKYSRFVEVRRGSFRFIQVRPGSSTFVQVRPGSSRFVQVCPGSPSL